MKQPTKTQTGPLYPNLWAEAQYNAKPWAMANKINATEEVVVKSFGEKSRSTWTRPSPFPGI